jgi:hypothetical protein
MDYVTRQFINLTKKLRKELRVALSLLSKQIEHQNAAIREATNAAKKPEHPQNILWTQLKVPPSERYKQETKDAKKSIIELWKLWAEILGIMVVIVYTVVSVFQWRTAHDALKDAKESSAKQFAQINSQLDAMRRANDIAIANNRPWIGLVPLESGTDFNYQQGRQGAYEFAQIRYMWSFKNGGERPARIEKIRTTLETVRECDNRPNYDLKSDDPEALTFSAMNSRAIIIPGTTIRSPFVWGVRRDKWEAIKGLKLKLCMYALIEYRDVGGDQSILHRTTECQVLIAVPDNFAVGQCDNSYADAN